MRCLWVNVRRRESRGKGRRAGVGKKKGKTFVGWSTCFSMEYSLLMTYQQLLKFKIKFNTNFTESSTGIVHIDDPLS